MKITGFIWLPEIVEKLDSKHNIDTDEILELFDGKPMVRFVERGQREGDDVYAALGQTEAGRYLIVFYVHKADGQALVISARDMSRGERRRYERR